MFNRFTQLAVPAMVAAVCACTSGGGGADRSVAGGAETIVYPPAPADAVIEWVGAIATRADVDDRKRTLKKVLVGAEEQEPSLVAPTSVAIGPDRTLYVIDQHFRGVLIINREQRRFDLFRGSSPGSLFEPVGVAVADDGTLYVSDATSQAVYAYDAELRFKAAFGGAEVLGRPTAIALSGDGSRLAVCDTDRHAVDVLDTASGETLHTIGGREHSDREGEFNFPVAAAFDAEGYLYVSDYLNFRVQVFDAAGDLDLVFGKAGDRPGDMNRPRGLAADASNGVLYQVDGAFQLVQMFNLDGELLMWFGEPGSGPGKFSLPSGIAIRDDLLVVADTLNRRVQLFRFLGSPQ
jgi:DNA-binding beta-propeller fold protein YncE